MKTKILLITGLVLLTVGCGGPKNLIGERTVSSSSVASTPTIQIDASTLTSGLAPYKVAISTSSLDVEVKNLPTALTKLKIRFVPMGGTYRDSSLRKFVTYNTDVSVGADINYNGKTVQTGLTKIGNKQSTVYDFSDVVDGSNDITISLSNIISDVECVAFSKYGSSSAQVDPLGSKCGGNVSVETDRITGYLEIETQDTKAL